MTSLTFEIIPRFIHPGIDYDFDVLPYQCKKRIDVVFVTGDYMAGVTWNNQTVALPEDLIDFLQDVEVLYIDRGLNHYLEITGSTDQLMMIKLAWDNDWGWSV